MLIKREKQKILIHDVLHKLNIVLIRDDSGKRCLTVSLIPYNKGFPRFYYLNNSRMSVFKIQRTASSPVLMAITHSGIKEAKRLTIKELIKA